MAFDEELAGRIRGELAGDPDVTGQRMFGGLALGGSGSKPRMCAPGAIS